MANQVLPGRSPRYALIAQALINDIGEGVYPVGGMLPGELELCQNFGVSRFTIREAMRVLREKGLVYRHQGIGTVVKASQVETRYVQEMKNLTDLAHYAGETSLKVTKTETIRSEGTIQELLKCKQGEMWLCIEGKRFRDQEAKEPIAYTYIYIPPAFVGIKELVGSVKVPIYTLIEKHYGENIVEVQQEISAIPIPEKVAKVLGQQAGSPGLCIVRRYSGEDGRTLEVAVNIHPGMRFSYAMSIRREWRSA